jgi:hypothetical protein
MAKPLIFYLFIYFLYVLVGVAEPCTLVVLAGGLATFKGPNPFFLALWGGRTYLEEPWGGFVPFSFWGWLQTNHGVA